MGFSTPATEVVGSVDRWTIGALTRWSRRGAGATPGPRGGGLSDDAGARDELPHSRARIDVRHASSAGRRTADEHRASWRTISASSDELTGELPGEPGIELVGLGPALDRVEGEVGLDDVAPEPGLLAHREQSQGVGDQGQGRVLASLHEIEVAIAHPDRVRLDVGGDLAMDPRRVVEQ